jgi:hypothetical protein
MKTLKNILIFLLIVSIGSVAANAQKPSKKELKKAAIRNDIESKRYTFIANNAIPMGGSSRQLTSEYDLKITPDSVISFLPYFGVAHFDVPYGSTDLGIKFTSTKFDYKATQNKKGGWQIIIKPKDVKNLQSMILYISSDGYGSLAVNSINRDNISFDGYLK